MLTATQSQTSDVTLPEWASALRDKLTNCSDQLGEVDVVMTWLGLPKYSDCPAPGVAKTWTFAEWSQWALEHGYGEAEERAHSFQWTHSIAPHLVVSTPKTTSDHRASLNIAMSVRKNLRLFAELAVVVTRYVLKIGSVEGDTSEESAKAFIIREAQDKSAGAKYAELGSQLAIANGVRAEIVQGVVAKIRNEFPKCTIRSVLESNGFGVDGAERIMSIIKIAHPDDKLPSLVYSTLNDHLLYCRAYESQEREARRNARSEKSEAKVKAPTPNEILQSVVDAHNKSVEKALDVLLGQSQSLVDRLRLLRNNPPKLANLPQFEDPTPLRNQVAELDVSLQSANALLETRTVELEAVKLQFAGVDIQAVRQYEELRHHLLALAGLVVDSVAAAKTANPFQLATMFNSLASEASSLVEKYTDKTPVESVSSDGKI